MATKIFENMIGKTYEVYRVDGVKTVVPDLRYSGGNEALVFEGDDGSAVVFTHEQDCCEGVSIEDIDNDLTVLCGSPLIVAEEVDCTQEDDDYGSHTWTFYKFATVKGHCTVRWYGESNGYYSESVDVLEFGTDGKYSDSLTRAFVFKPDARE